VKFHVVLEKQKEGGYVAYVPELPGCHTQGETREQAIKNIREARDLYLQVLRDRHKHVVPRVEVMPLPG